MRRVLMFALIALALGAPVHAFSQQGQKVVRLGRLAPLSAATDTRYKEALLQGLRELGWIEGKNIEIEYRYADGQLDKLPALAADMARRRVDVMVVGSTPGALAAKQATSIIPIVMVTTGDPVANGLVKSLARPGGNITGMISLAQELGAKRLELFRETFPAAGLIAVLSNPDTPDTRQSVLGVENAARALGIKIRLLSARDPAAIGNAFTTLKKDGVKALMVLQDPMFLTQQKLIIGLAASNRIPVIYGIQDFVDVGGLMFYGVDLSDMYRRAASHVDKILKGAKPADLPIEQPTKFELVINAKTAKALGIKIPDSIMLRADKVIE
jgi:putative tryptophan/tyrosine transport system substrate-binding protein